MLRTTLTATRCSFRPKLSARCAARKIPECHFADFYSKAFSTTSAWHTINSLHTFTEEEELLRESGMPSITYCLSIHALTSPRSEAFRTGCR